MAGTVTHHKFSNDVSKKLKNKIIFNKDLFYLASQGHDLGMFYKWYNLKLRGKTHKFALEVLQDKNFLEYIYNYLNYIKSNNLCNNSEVKNYLYGYIAHHYLDSFVHPYIINITGEVDKNDKNTYKYAGLHCLYETQVDKTFLEQFYNNKDVHKIFPKHIYYSNKLLDANNYAFLKTYNNKDYGTYFIEAMNDVYPFLKIFRNDPIKLKKIIYKSLDLALKGINSTSRYDFLSFALKSIDYKELYKEEVWNDPTNNEMYYSSFMDLYNEALILVINVIEILEDIITDSNKSADLIYNKNVPNRSAIHGHECNKNLKLKYFKY